MTSFTSPAQEGEGAPPVAPDDGRAGSPGPAAEQMVDRMQELIARSEEIADPQVRELVQELTGAVLDLYGEGLARIVEAIEQGGPELGELREHLLRDGVVSSLLLIHDLYPVEVGERVLEALDSVRPYMESHGGGVELLGVQDGVARLRLQGSCSGCAASQATLELAIREAIEQYAPDLLGLEVEGVAEPPTRPDSPPSAPGAFQLPMVPPPELRALSAHQMPDEPMPASGPTLPAMPLPLAPVAPAPANLSAGRSNWRALDGVDDLRPGGLRRREIDGAALVLANVDGTLLAYLDACAACSGSLAQGSLDGPILTCPGCGARYDLPRAGLAVGGGTGQLGPVPLLEREGGAVTIALPA